MIVALVWACAPQIPHPLAAQVELARKSWPDVTAESLERGRTLYIARCGGCHNLYPPAEISAERWPGIVGAMVSHARLTPDERDDVLHYLLSVTAQPER